jgi:DNA repair exonuclease SbcCD ATPase subunit
MKIHELIVSNVKRVRAVTLNLFNGQHAVLGGRNEQGKSSVLDAITMALAGGDAICEKPIRDGAINGEVTVDLGEIVVTRKFTPKGSSLTVKDKEGNVQSSPQTLLDKLIGKLGFDPLAFSQLDAKAQRNALAKLAGLDFTNVDADFQAFYDKRRDLNRDHEKVTAKLAGRTTFNVPETEVSVDALVKELEEAKKVNGQRDTLRLLLDGWNRSVLESSHNLDRAGKEVDRLKAALAEAEKNYTLCQENFTKVETGRQEAKQKFEQAPQVDTAPITNRIVEADGINAKVRSNRELKGLMDESARLVALVRECNRAMDANSERKAESIRNAKFPLPGLAITDDCVLVNGVPLKQASSAQQIKIGAAIGAALNPTLRVMIVRGGAYLDENSLVELLKWGTENGIQLFIERVGDGKECSVIIEDGCVLENRTEQVAA